MKLHELRANEGKIKPHRRVGRGTAGRRGKTAGRGTKGQGARAGGGPGLYHQGGNLPFFRRLPFKRGFNVPFRQFYNEVNLDQLGDLQGEVNPQTLDGASLLRDPRYPVVLLGRGDVKSALKVRVHRVSASAKAKVENAGGSVEIIEQVAPAKVEKTEPSEEPKAKAAKPKASTAKPKKKVAKAKKASKK
ncbi:MAG: 50S ribosomal protein L15 [Anaerolineales bacterium]